MSQKQAPSDPRQFSLELGSESPGETPAKKEAAKNTASGSESGAKSWAPEIKWAPQAASLDALLLAAELNHTDLVDSLLSLHHAWDLGAKESGTRRIQGLQHSDAGKTALHLLLRARGNTGWGQEKFENNTARAQAQALELTRRGADFLALSEDRQSALGIAAAGARQDFIKGLKGHPDYAYDRIKGLRVGSLTGDAPQDSRRPLLAHLIHSGHIEAFTSLIVDARWPINATDDLGRLPLGYSRLAHVTDALIKLGADPAQLDKDGQNAMERAQEAESTQERDKMIGLIGAALRKGAAKNDPALMAQLQAQNIPALIEAAESSPKSSMLKLISAFKFDVSKVKDPATGATPLMAALRGGRISSATHLLDAGCSINAQDNNGLSAAGYLLLGATAAGTQHQNGATLYTLAKPLVDWSLTNKQGFPVAFHPFFAHTGMDSGLLTTALTRVCRAAVDHKAPIRGPNQEPLMSVFTPALGRSDRVWNLFDMLCKGLAHTIELGQMDGVDALLELGIQRATPQGIQNIYSGGAKPFFSQIEKLMEQGALPPESLIASTQIFDQANPERKEMLAEHLPGIYAFLELCSLRQDQGAGIGRKRGPRL